MIISVAAKNVRPGDKIYNSCAPPADRWVIIKSVTPRGNNIVIQTAAFDTWKHPEEGVTVHRLS